MRLKTVRRLTERKTPLTAFYGLQRLKNVRPGAFYDAQNLSTADFPSLSVRKKRVFTPFSFTPEGEVTHILPQNGGVAVCTENAVYWNGVSLGLTLESGVKSRRAVPFGRNFYILPDCVYVTFDGSGAPVASPASWTRSYAAADVSTRPVYADFTTLDQPYFRAGTEPPMDPVTFPAWIDLTGGKMKVRLFRDGVWQPGRELFIAFEAAGIDAGVSPGDTLTVRGWEGGPHKVTVVSAEPGRLLTTGALILSQASGTAKISRAVPVPDFCFELGNRLWGCRCGETDDGFVNEILCSALGDPTAWSVFRGLSTDAWRVTLGAPGPFTGAAAVDGAPVFFKEDRLFTVYGAVPSDFSLRETAGAGVKAGAEKTLCVSGERAYYCSPGGPAVYDGVLPSLLPEAFPPDFVGGRFAAAAGRRWVLACDFGEERRLLVYDLDLGLWQTEDDPGLLSLAPFRGAILGVTQAGVFSEAGEAPPGGAFGTQTVSEGDVRWFAETGLLVPDSPSFYLRRLTLRASSEGEAKLSVCLRGSPKEAWRRVFTRKGTFEGTFSLPLLGKKLDGVALRLEGEGALRIGALTLTTAAGGEVDRNGR